jgi:integrase
VALFLTGGRVTEVLNLKKEMFKPGTLPDGTRFVTVKNMLLEKRYKKVGKKYLDEDGNNRFKTEKLIATRMPFSFRIDEPLAPILLDWIEKSPEGLLFPSPYHHKGEKKGERPLTRNWAYKYIRFLDRIIPNSLKEALGMNEPFIKNGVQVGDSLHLWCHWFRSQRASQLARDYHFDIQELMKYFSWTKVETALRYLHLSPEQFAAKMHVDTYE